MNGEVELGAGTVVFDGAVVNPGVATGPICIVNTNATVEHDCRLGTNVHIGPGATVSGGVRIGDHTFVGAGAVIIHGVRIVAGCLIGAGAVVTDDLTEPGTYVGLPPEDPMTDVRRPCGDPRPRRIAAGTAQEHPRDAWPAAARLLDRGCAEQRPVRRVVVSTDDAEIATVARAEGTFHLPGRTGREIDWTHAIDIDTEEDWRLADALMGRS